MHDAFKRSNSLHSSSCTSNRDIDVDEHGIEGQKSDCHCRDDRARSTIRGPCSTRCRSWSRRRGWRPAPFASGFKLGLLPAPDFRGRATTYGPEHLLRIRAVQLLRGQKLGLRQVKKRLASTSTAELERMLAPPPSAIGDRPPPRAPAYPAEQWERIVLAPGLEVHVRADAGALLRRVADDIYRHYGAARVLESPG